MAQLDTFFKIAHDLFCIVDRNGYYKRVNPALTKLLAYPEQELMQHPFTYFIHPEDVAETKKEYDEVRQVKRNQILVNRFRSFDSRYHWISWSTIVQDERGEFYSTGQNITEQKRLEEALQKERQESQQRLIRTVISTQEREHTQIHRDLHDNVNQVLTTVKLFMDLCRDKPELIKEILEKAVGLQQAVITEIRNRSKRLSAPSLGNIKLSDSVREVILLFKETHKTHITLNVHNIEELEVEQEVHLAVYRIVQEQLTNISKHAGADKVDVALDFAEGKLSMAIRDNGKGFNTQERCSGIGLHNMRTRAESVGGTLLIKSTPGAGTVVLLQIPLVNE